MITIRSLIAEHGVDSTELVIETAFDIAASVCEFWADRAVMEKHPPYTLEDAVISDALAQRTRDAIAAIVPAE